MKVAIFYLTCRDNREIDKISKVLLERQLVVRFTGKKLIKILEWYREMITQTYDATIPTFIETLPNPKTRKLYELGLTVIGNSRTDLDGLGKVREATVWQRGGSRVLEYVFKNPNPQTSDLLVDEAR
ncbi:MAG: hypothetical protein HYV38_01225 [Candidatus Levybacteria bacterium]|nr:hypothetical protein [Candidatus Levybacteria bacterium]